MELEIGIVCGSCDQYSSLGTTRCPSCGDDLAVLARKPGSKSVASTPAVQQPPASDVVSKAPAARVASPAAPPVAPPAAASPVAAPPRTAASTGNISTPGALFTEPLRRRVSPMPGPGGLRAQSAQSAQFGTVPQPPGPRASNLSSTLSEEELMDQAKNFVCRSCSTPVPLQHKFCGRCGAAVPPEILGARTQFFGQLQAPGRAKLILIRGEGVEGLSYQLNAEEHIVGRNGQLMFPDDPFVSPRHANLFYRNEQARRPRRGLAQRRVPPRARDGRAPHGRPLSRGRAALPARADPEGERRPGAGRHVLLLVAQAPEPLPHHPDPHGGAPGMAVCARGAACRLGARGATSTSRATST